MEPHLIHHGDMAVREVEMILRTGEAALADSDLDAAVMAAVRLGICHYYLSDVRPPLAFVNALLGCSLTARDHAMVSAARARLLTRLPLMDSESTVGAAADQDSPFWVRPFWMPRAHESQALADEALRLLTPDIDTLASTAVRTAWRSVHRSPAFRPSAPDERHVDDVSLADAFGCTLAIDVEIDALMWRAVDALEYGSRFDYDVLIREAAALVSLGTLHHLEWWVRSALVTRALHEGRPQEAMQHADRAADFARERGLLGAPSVLAIQRWYIDELRNDHSFGVEVGLLSPRAVEHPLSAVCPALSMARAGLTSLAAPWAAWAADYLHRGSEESSWLAVITISSDLARLLVLDEHPEGLRLAREVMPHLDKYRHHMAIDTRAVLTMGPVARAGADLALTLGDLDAATAFLHDASAVVERMGNPVISVAELAICASRCALASADVSSDRFRRALQVTTIAGLERLHLEAVEVDAEASAAVGPSQLTVREERVLELLALGMSNPEIASELAYSRATIAKDVRRLYAKLGAPDRAALAKLGRERSRE